MYGNLFDKHVQPDCAPRDHTLNIFTVAVGSAKCMVQRFTNCFKLLLNVEGHGKKMVTVCMCTSHNPMILFQL